MWFLRKNVLSEHLWTEVLLSRMWGRGPKAAARVELTCSYLREGVYWRHRGKSITSKYCSFPAKILQEQSDGLPER